MQITMRFILRSECDLCCISWKVHHFANALSTLPRDHFSHQCDILLMTGIEPVLIHKVYSACVADPHSWHGALVNCMIVLGSCQWLRKSGMSAKSDHSESYLIYSCRKIEQSESSMSGKSDHSYFCRIFRKVRKVGKVRKVRKVRVRVRKVRIALHWTGTHTHSHF